MQVFPWTGMYGEQLHSPMTTVPSSTDYPHHLAKSLLPSSHRPAQAAAVLIHCHYSL